MKNSFLNELAEILFRKFRDEMGDVRIIFPNRRAGLFFTKALASYIEHPIWSPQIYSLEDFIYSQGNIQKGEHLALSLDLYEVFQEKIRTGETFERFYFWGDMLLRDFDEIDKYLLKADDIFSTLKNLKEIDIRFQFFSDEQKKALDSFWSAAGNNPSVQKDKFLRFWSSLAPVYHEFRSRLLKKGYAYQGMIYRSLVVKMSKDEFNWDGGKVIFAGFNALTNAEEKIIKWFITQGSGEIYWDLDAWYFEDHAHEAGYFLRKYSQDRDFRGSFPGRIPVHFKTAEKRINTYASSQYTGQVKIAGSILDRIRKNNQGALLENIAVILPDENLLSNLLYSLPAEIDRINITMGYSLKNSAFFSLIENLLELQEQARKGKSADWFNHRPVVNLLNHPYIRSHLESISGNLVRSIQDKNLIYVPSDFFVETELFRFLFKIVEPDRLIDYLLDVLVRIRASFDDADDKYYFENEFAVVFYRVLNQLKDTFHNRDIQVTAQLLRRIIGSYSRFEKIPFTGEPLEGLQIMGLLETRNLDFDHVIVLCMNEGSIPASTGPNSFIPFNVRKAFGLPLPENQDAMYAYLFYRLLQRSKDIHLVYNTEQSNYRDAEPSRYIHQLNFESNHKIVSNVLMSRASVSRVSPVSISKDTFLLSRLLNFLAGEGNHKPKYLTPSKLNMYLSCPLSFCYRNLYGIEEKLEVTEDLDSAKFGNILHKTMEELYKPFIGASVTGKDFKKLSDSVDEAIQAGFAEYHGFKEWNQYRFEGKNILGREIIKKIVRKILEHDQKNVPFSILGLEKTYSMALPVSLGNDVKHILIRGTIDRIDIHGDAVRIIDYKSGGDFASFDSVEKLFDATDQRRNKAVFQTLLYALLYLNNHPENQHPIISGIYNFKELHEQYFDVRIKFKKRNPTPDEIITDVRNLMDEYTELLKDLLREIFDPDIPFSHHEDKTKCVYCSSLGAPSELS